MSAHPTPPAPGSPTRRSPALGILLVVPMLLATVVCMGWPSIDALLRAVVGAETPVGSTGPAGWAMVLADAGGLAVAGLVQTVPVVVAGTLVAIPVAQALAVGAVAARIGVAALVTLPMPLAAGAWWATGPGEIGAAGAIGVATAAQLPSVAGIAAIVLVPIVRAGLRPLPAMLAAVAIGAATAAVALQSPITGVFATGGATTVPARSFQVGFQRFELADGAAYDVLVLLSLGVVGIAAVALLALLRPAVAVQSVVAARPLAATIGSTVAIVGAVLALAMPLLLATAGEAGDDLLAALVPAAIGTWVPALVGAVVATVLAVAAAIGIGWVAPLGRHSLWLLLPFAPALLVTATPLVASAYLERVALGVGPLPMLPTIVVSVPLLVALTLLTAGMRRAGRLDVRTLAWAALVGFAVLAATNAQAIQPAQVLAMIDESSIVLQIAALSAFAGSGAPVGIAALTTTVPVGVLLGAVVVLGLGPLRGATLVLGDEPLQAAAGPQAWPAQHAQAGASVAPAPPRPGTQVPPPGWPPPVAPPQP